MRPLFHIEFGVKNKGVHTYDDMQHALWMMVTGLSLDFALRKQNLYESASSQFMQQIQRLQCV